jgi:cyclohexanecarboxylate-CoA ligase
LQCPTGAVTRLRFYSVARRGPSSSLTTRREDGYANEHSLVRAKADTAVLYETILTRELANRYRAAGWWPDRLLNDAVAEAAARRPGRIALVDAHHRMTYAELQAQADHCALGLLVLGVRRGDVVTAQLPNWNEFVVLTLALERIGAVINPVAPIFRQRELGVMLKLAGSVAVVIPASFRGWDYPAMYADLRRATPSLKHVIVVGDASDDDAEGMLSWSQLLATGAEQSATGPVLDWLRPSPNDVTTLEFTSGTTGEPKGVLHTPNTLGAGLDAMIHGQQLSPDDVFHMASTVGHHSGFQYGVRLPLHLGARAVFQETWDPAAFVRLIETERVTFSLGATPFLADTLRAANLTEHDISSFRIFVCGGAPIPRPLAEEASRRLPCRLVPVWGMTENSAVTAVLPNDPVERIVSTDGQAFPGMEVRVVGDETGIALPPGQEGDLFARGAFLFAGYVQGRRFTEQYFTPDGWFATGDRAAMDALGFIRITGRSKDIIIRGGENIPVREIEDLLLRHPQVRGVALVGLPDPRLGEIACACIIPESGQPLTLEQIRSFMMNERVTRSFWPERLEYMDEFPMTPSGKVQKFRLRELVTTRQMVSAG